MQTVYNLEPAMGQEGDWADIGPNVRVREYTNAQANAAQVTTGTVVANNGDTVGVYIDGVLVSVVSTASASGTATLLKDAINANDFVKSKVVATSLAAVLTLTFLDYLPHTVTAYSPATADVTPIANTTTAAAEETTPFGRAVVQSAVGDRFFRLPATGAVQFVGVLVRSFAVAPQLLPTGVTSGLPPRKPGDVVKQGRVLVLVETNVTPASTVYFRHNAPGAEPEALGRFRADNDGGDATAAPAGVKFVTSATAGSLAELEINIP